MEKVRRETDTALEDSYDTELQIPANKASCGVGSATLQPPESSADNMLKGHVISKSRTEYMSVLKRYSVTGQFLLRT